jgi:hypothetical protein
LGTGPFINPVDTVDTVDTIDTVGKAASGSARSRIITASDALCSSHDWWRQASRTTRLTMFRSGAAGASRLDTDKIKALETGFAAAPTTADAVAFERK